MKQLLAIGEALIDFAPEETGKEDVYKRQGQYLFRWRGPVPDEAGGTWPRDHPDTERCGIRRTDRTIYPHIRKIRSYKIDRLYIWRKGL